jgi:hypothetical protein
MTTTILAAIPAPPINDEMPVLAGAVLYKSEAQLRRTAGEPRPTAPAGSLAQPPLEQVRSAR